ncbi:MAG TPA: hypothetical protein DF613_14615 [Lachnospiraceae bacterium]|nr:hypothetical protein [Lachnospiraceae bacterium]
MAKALCAGNVPVAEVTFRAAGADTAIRLMKETCPEMIVGAGTVTEKTQIDAAIAAGGISLKNLSEYIASPVIAACGGSYMVTADLIDGQEREEITRLCKKSRDIVESTRLGRAVIDIPVAMPASGAEIAPGQYAENSTGTAQKI